MKRLLSLLLLSATPVLADAPRVVTDIAPVHSLVSMVMDGVGTPDLVIPANASPHNFAMRPSQAQMLSDADAFVWIGHGLTPWMEEPVERLAKDAAMLELMEVEGIHLLPFREGALFKAEGDGDGDGQDHDHDHDHGHGDEEGSDPHVWLDPDNGMLFLNAIAAQLSKLDPENAATYAANAAKGRDTLDALKAEITATLAPARGQSFIVLHDGFHYFEDHFEFEAVGAISPSDAAAPGAARIKALRAALPDSDLKCAFSEPQANGRIIETVIEGMSVETAVLDPLGANFGAGTTLYPALLKSMAQSMAGCLTH